MSIENINNQKINFLEANLNRNQNLETNNFFNDFQIALKNISNIQNNHEEKNIQKFNNNSNLSLNRAMINLQKSSISIELAIQIRNKVIEAYKEIMNQQV